ncbi:MULTISPECIES: hypothetical protein [Pseudoalteromonas]|uniref:Membrane protein triplicated sequence n=1 Tax=Pseudoalteromonas lipolytica TaxID=570156 RepID=A0ABU8SSN0_9GAMM|nr:MULTISPECIES: hypothetical protein [unclassified Pseudoalteromonas]MBC7008025.1 hypothetical protein [Pseudoalteromonas sp. BZK2]TMP47644.1 hypothetical protein CWB80_06510 [Pseudoalteromonas sp. S1650]TMP67960.1 hypothetical protein CWB79_07130 [Pseudoalteromonas sp. S1649]
MAEFHKYVSAYLATFIMWGFLMAFLYNMVSKSIVPNGDKTLMWISLTMFLSYLASDPLTSATFQIESMSYATAYVVWTVLDLTCIGAILLITKDKSIYSYPAKLYVILGLLINCSLFISMYIDINILENTEEWWLWGFYTVTVNIVDAMMLIALFSNKDFLGLVKLYRQVRGQAEPA